MRRALLALLLAAAAFAATLFIEASPGGRFGREWLASVSHPDPLATVAVVQTPRAASAMDAALALRVVLRYSPKGIVFLDPITNREGLPFLLSKLGDTTSPVVFSSNASLPFLTGVSGNAAMPTLLPVEAVAPAGFAAGCGGLVMVGRSGPHVVASSALQLLLSVDRIPPANVRGKVPGELRAGGLLASVDAAGRSAVNPLANRLVKRIDFDRMLIRAERSEQGEISVDLDNLFRDRLVAVETAGETGGVLLAAFRNGLVEAAAPPWAGFVGIFLIASLPWWRFRRLRRVLLAAIVGGVWVLLALAIFKEARVAAPLVPALLLPLFAGLIPASNKAESGKRPA